MYDRTVVLGPAAAPRGPVVSSLVVGLVAVALTLRHGPRSPVPGGWTWLAVLGTPCALVLAGGGAAVAGATALGATLALPIVLLVAGGADPRFAVAAAVAWTWRFLAVDPSDVVAAIGAVRTSGIEPVFLRLGAMAWAIALAVLVARRSQRAAAL